ncbi:zinc finger mynd domain-containing protein, partial [Moniliophthora roreri]
MDMHSCSRSENPPSVSLTVCCDRECNISVRTAGHSFGHGKSF